ncbi:MAG: hypothetical protein ABEH77_04810 [Halobacteriaceae archaeon]
MARLAVALAVLLATAGCGAPAGAGADRTTLAPGVTADGIVNASALADAHRARLRSHSFTMHRRYVQRVAGAGYRIAHDQTLRVGPGGAFSYVHRVTGRENGTPIERTTRVYAAGETVWVRRSNGTGASVERHPRDEFPFGPTDYWAVRHVAVLPPADLVAVESRPGGRRYRLVYRHRNPAGAPGEWNETTRILLRESGLVARIDTTADTPRAAGHLYLDVHLAYVRVGNTTVDRPAWAG